MIKWLSTIEVDRTLRFSEKAVLVHFLALTLLWFTRNPGFIKGWSILFKPKYITDGTVGITVGLSLFLFPSRMPSFNCFSQPESAIAAPGLLDWPTVKRKMAWNVILLMGGGFALADACGYTRRCKQNAFRPESAQLYRQKAAEWFTWEAARTGQVIRHQVNGREKRIGKLPVDGWYQEPRIAYQFHECFFHGCPCTGVEINYVNEKPMTHRNTKTRRTYDAL
ncbi:hypothetical protein LSAT2_009710 [Lamellibrachia satsuma]|nr:hypothetical protein LSAT2_009710 [Lamellibrachia satsuma]